MKRSSSFFASFDVLITISAARRAQNVGRLVCLCATKYRFPIYYAWSVTVSLQWKNYARLQQLCCQKLTAIHISAGNSLSQLIALLWWSADGKIWHCDIRSLLVYMSSVFFSTTLSHFTPLHSLLYVAGCRVTSQQPRRSYFPLA